MGQIEVLLSGFHVLLVASGYQLSYFSVCIKFKFNIFAFSAKDPPPPTIFPSP